MDVAVRARGFQMLSSIALPPNEENGVEHLNVTLRNQFWEIN